MRNIPWKRNREINENKSSMQLHTSCTVYKRRHWPKGRQLQKGRKSGSSRLKRGQKKILAVGAKQVMILPQRTLSYRQPKYSLCGVPCRYLSNMGYQRSMIITLHIFQTQRETQPHDCIA